MDDELKQLAKELAATPEELVKHSPEWVKATIADAKAIMEKV